MKPRPSIRHRLPLGLIALACLAGFGAQPGSNRVLGAPAASPVKAPAAPVRTTLAALHADPVAWRATEVELDVQLAEIHTTWRYWTTRFQPARYVGFSAWGDEVLLWDAAAYERPAQRLFAAKGSLAARALEGAPRYRRYRVRAVLRTVFDGQAWIEVLDATPLPRAMGDGTILHATRAFDLLEADAHAAAAEQFERALAAPMPARPKAVLEEHRDAARLAAGKVGP